MGWHAIVVAESATTALVSLLVLIPVSVLVLVKNYKYSFCLMAEASDHVYV